MKKGYFLILSTLSIVMAFLFINLIIQMHYDIQEAKEANNIEIH